jgi:hypothetical protein
MTDQERMRIRQAQSQQVLHRAKPVSLPAFEAIQAAADRRAAMRQEQEAGE